MISLKVKFSDEFIGAYADYCISYLMGNINDIISETDGVISSKLSQLFTEVELRKIISAEPAELLMIANRIYSEIPILAERYHQKVFFSKFSFEDDYINLNLRTKQGKIKIFEIKDKIISEIKKFQTSSPSILLEDILENIENLTRPSDIKNELNTIKSIINGTCQADQDFVGKFPKWVEAFAKAFNYSYVMRTYGQSIVAFIDLEYCPYCADEEIEAFDSFRPAIDHYFPQSKFPFLALSLYNFIPSGNRCNSNYKKAKTMEGHFHPNLDEVPSQRLFNFLYPVDRIFTEEDVQIGLNNICYKLEANTKLFRIDEVYNKSGIKRKFVSLHERINWLIQDGIDSNNIISDPEQFRRHLAFDLALPNKKFQHKKFIVDSINLLWDCNLTID
ncbi:hypothetical protein [Acinetobacter oleivorans]|uniref:hypothetical protein n=1 Tax=Acinetobacter oleivorans TaxID=1148157 RepID=UPI003F7C3471